MYVGNIALGEKEVRLTSTDSQDDLIVKTTVIEGGGSGSVVTLSAGEIRGFTITGGKAEDGGGIHCVGAAVIARNVICGNRASARGGGIFCSGSSALVSDNTIFSNRGRDGGGIYCFQSTDIVAHNEIRGNEASWGAAIHCFCASAQLSSNTIKENTARERAGAICCDFSSGTVISNNLIFRNSACGWATISCLDGNKHPGPNIGNNTLAFNEGGGISAFDCIPLIRDCVLWQNGVNMERCSATYCCVDTGDPGEGNFAYDPQFIDPAEGDFRLNSWSPCIDAGHPASDFSNEPEPNGGRVNVGACGNTAAAAVKCPDTDQDSLPDDWETKRFGDLHENGDGDADQDAIGHNIEYLYGWDPTAPPVAIVENATKGEVYQTIQAAICESQDGDVLVVHPGRHEEHFGFGGKAVVLRSLDPTDSEIVAQTVVDGMGVCSVAMFCCGEARDSVINGLTITGGRGVRGGGVYCSGSSPTIAGNVISRNSALLSGAAIYCGDESSPLIHGNTISENVRAGPAFDPEAIHCSSSSPKISNNLITANDGSGIRCEYSHPIIVGNTITEHVADRGGGILCYYSSPEIRGNLISHNTATYKWDLYHYGNGGGIYCERSGPVIVENVIRENRSRYSGAAICCIDSYPYILKNTIVGNVSEEGRAAVYCWDFCHGAIANNVIARNFAGGIECCGHTSPAIVNNTIVYNCLSGRGYGLHLSLVQQEPIAVNCIIWGNGEDIYGVEPHYCCLQNSPAEYHNVGWFPYFVDPENGDYHLLPWSPCIDAGDPTSDFSNEPQPNGGRVNIGAYANTPEAEVASPDMDNDELPDSWEQLWFDDLSQEGENDADYDGILNVTEYLFNSDPITVPSPNRVQNLRSLIVYPTIGAAISEAEDGDELVAYPATYRENISFVGKAITVRSLNPEDADLVASTVIEADLPRSVATFTAGEGWDSVLAGFTITGGDADVGGGIYCWDGSPTIRNNVIRSNKADRGGGVCFRGYSPALFVENEVIANAAREGGGVSCLWSSAPVLEGNRIFSNHADEDGGGIYCDDLFAVVRGNFIRGNSAGRYGGGIYGESETISNNVIVGNTAGDKGGAVCAVGRETMLVNNTIVGNRASSVGGVTTYYYDCRASLLNCILWDNEDDIRGCGFSYCCVQNLDGACEWGNNVGQGNFSLFPHFLDPDRGNYHLASWSPCIDAGDPQSDFSNEPEPNGGRIDLGAYGNTPEATSKSFDRDGDDLPDDWELHYFGDLSQTAFADPDGDEIFNVDEYLYGWDPDTRESVGVRNLVSGRTYPRIQDAIDKAQDRDEVVARPGRYREQIDFLGKNVTLRSLHPEDPQTVATTIIDAERRGTVVSFINGEGREAVISGFTITGCGGEDYGGIYCRDSSPTIVRNVVTGNEPCEYYGGGITCSGGSPLIAFNTITKNRSCGGGAGIQCSGGSPTIVNNLIEDNDGGGISCWGGLPVIKGNLIRFNRTWSFGSGIRCSECPALIQNNVIADNWAGSNGGGIGCSGDASLKIINNTITGNVAIDGGAGIYAEGNSSPMIENCIICNRGTELVGCSASYSCVRGGVPGDGNISAFPYFVDPANGDYHLATWSPCIDAGNPTSPFDNEPQPNGGRIDMGAYGNTPEATSKSRDIDRDGLPDTWEVGYFGGLHEIPESDADGDFIPNGAEYRFGWDPKTPAPGRAVNRTTNRWYQEVQPTLYEAEEGAEIVVLPGTYHENLVFPAFSLTLTSIDPSDAAVVGSTVIDADGFGSAITVIGAPEATVRICGLTITGGSADRGGGIHCEGVTAVIENNLITNNSAHLVGAGICCVDCSARITGNTITSNECEGGSASGICSEDSSAFIADNIVSGNSCMYAGAGMACFRGSAVIRNNFVAENRCEDGGGIYCGSCMVEISGNQIHCNDAYHNGGGLHLEEATATVVGNVLSGNRAYGSGAGISCVDSSATLNNNTIADHWSNAYRGSVHSENSSLTLTNCILWRNTDDLYGCSATYSCIEDTGGENEGEGNIHADPLFVDPAHGDYHLRAGSACVDAGNNDAPNIPSMDMDGEFRPFGLRVDMGADEFLDQDEDLLPDYWEIRNFANLWFDAEDDPDADSLPNSQELAHSTSPHSPDTDSDGKSDPDEVFAGTDPLDATSALRITRVAHTSDGAVVEWLVVPGKNYQAYVSSDLTAWSALGETVRAEASDTSLLVVHAQASALDKSFYRVEVLP